MVLGHEAIKVPNPNPVSPIDSDDLKQTLWLLPIIACWQGHALLSLFTSELVSPFVNLSIVLNSLLS